MRFDGVAARWQEVLSRADARFDAVLEKIPGLGRARAYVTPVALLVCLAVTVAPIFAARDVPLVDLPSHLAAIYTWDNIDDPSLGFSQYYEVNLKLVPYWAYYGSVKLLSSFMPIRLANKVFMLFTIVSLMAGVLALLRYHQRSSMLAVVALLMAWNHAVWFGFLSYVGGFGLLFYGYALLARLGDGKPPAKLLVANAAAGLGLFFFHPLLLFFWLLGVANYAWNRYAAVALPVLLLFAVQLSGTFSANNKNVIVIAGEWRTPLDNFRRLFQTNALHYLGSAWITSVLVAIGLSLAAYWLLARPDAGNKKDTRPWRLALLLFLSYFALPTHLTQPMGFHALNTRTGFAVVIAAVFFTPAGDLRSWRKLVVAAPIVALCLAYHGTLFGQFRDYDRRSENFYEVIRPLPENPRVLTLVYDPMDPDLRSNMWRKQAAYVQLEKGGFSTNIWAKWQGIGREGFPVGYKKGKAPPTPDPPGKFSWDRYGRHYDYFLTRSEPNGLFTSRSDFLELVAARGEWKLWHRTGPVTR